MDMTSKAVSLELLPHLLIMQAAHAVQNLMDSLEPCPVKVRILLSHDVRDSLVVALHHSHSPPIVPSEKPEGHIGIKSVHHLAMLLFHGLNKPLHRPQFLNQLVIGIVAHISKRGFLLILPGNDVLPPLHSVHLIPPLESLLQINELVCYLRVVPHSLLEDFSLLGIVIRCPRLNPVRNISVQLLIRLHTQLLKSSPGKEWQHTLPVICVLGTDNLLEAVIHSRHLRVNLAIANLDARYFLHHALEHTPILRRICRPALGEEVLHTMHIAFLAVISRINGILA